MRYIDAREKEVVVGSAAALVAHLAVWVEVYLAVEEVFLGEVGLASLDFSLKGAEKVASAVMVKAA